MFEIVKKIISTCTPEIWLRLKTFTSADSSFGSNGSKKLCITKRSKLIFQTYMTYEKFTDNQLR